MILPALGRYRHLIPYYIRFCSATIRIEAARLKRAKLACTPKTPPK